MAESSFLFLAQSPWLDFVNTLVMEDGEPVDLLRTPADLRAWLAAMGEHHGWPVRPASRWSRAQGEASLALAREVRADLARLAHAAAQGEPLPNSAVRGLQKFLDRWALHYEITVDDGLQVAPVLDDRDPLASLVQVVASASLVLGPRVQARVGQCAGPRCILTFLDTSRNGARRWCSMATCGNRAKAAAHHARARAADME